MHLRLAVMIGGTLAVTLAMGCGPGTPAAQRERASAAAASKPWSSTQGVTFRPPPATQGTPQRVTTRAAPRTLAQILQDVSPTPQQRAAADGALRQAQQEWVTWLAEHRGQLEALLPRMRQAAEARDRAELARVHAQWEPIVKTIPRPPAAWNRMRAAFAPEQQPQLERLSKEALPRVGDALHEAVKPPPTAPEHGTARACQVCHRPHYEIN